MHYFRDKTRFTDSVEFQNRFASQPDIYKQFLEILQTYQRDLKPIQDVYAQVTQLFSSAPDLLEDFKQFLPESAAQAKAQAAARQATEDAATLNNLRGDPSYISSMHPSQSQTPKPEMRMPPVGNFAPPSSAGKDNKKRRGGAGTQITVGTVPLDTQGPGSQIKASNIRTGPSNKVRPRISRLHQIPTRGASTHLCLFFLLCCLALRILPPPLCIRSISILV